MDHIVDNMKGLFYDVGVFSQGLGQSFSPGAAAAAPDAEKPEAEASKPEPEIKMFERKYESVAEEMVSFVRQKQWLEHTWDINHEQEAEPNPKEVQFQQKEVEHTEVFQAKQEKTEPAPVTTTAPQAEATGQSSDVDAGPQLQAGDFDGAVAKEPVASTQ